MAKKSPIRRKEGKDDRELFDDKSYEGTLFSATFDYNELCLMRAAEHLAPRLKNVLTIANMGLLILLILLALMLGNDAWLLLIVIFLITAVLLYVTQNWSKVQANYARRTSLDPACLGGRMRVTVCEDAVHVQDETGREAIFALSDLRTVYSNSDFLLAGFSGRRYAYIPRSAMSENRFRDVVRFLTEKNGK